MKITDSNKKKQENATVMSISVTEPFIQDLEACQKNMKYANRSELVRDALRLFISENKVLDSLEGAVEGAMLLLYSHSAGRMVSDIRHENMDIIISFMHNDFNQTSDSCCEVLMFSGDSDKVKNLVRSLKAIKNVEKVEIFLA